MGSDPGLWIAADEARLLARPLDTLTALYDRASGQTHLLAAPLPEILACLGDGPATLPGLIARMNARYDLSDQDDAAALVAERLEELAAMGLVARG